MNLDTCFALLNLAPDATAEEAKHAYKAQVRRWHPDQFPVGSVSQMGAQEQLKKVNVAYTRVKAHLASRPHPEKKSAAQASPRSTPPPETEPPKAPRASQKGSWFDGLAHVLNAFSAGGADPSTAAGKKKKPDKRRKTFGQVLDEMTADITPPKKRSADRSYRVKHPADRYGRRRRGSTIGGVGGIQSPGPIKPIGRVRGIGKGR